MLQGSALQSESSECCVPLESSHILPSATQKIGLGDAQLVARLHTGDEAAMAELYDRFSPVVYAVALRVLGSTGEAEDVLQEVFMQLWRKPSAFNASRGALAAWMAVIARHRAIDLLRKRRPETDLETIQVSSDLDVEDETSRNLLLQRITSGLDSLSTEQRAAVEMAFFEGMTHSEIAKKTGEPLGTIKTRIRSGLISLRGALSKAGR
jgi:RNA polymerase sigma-70 factor (ECF subfamily)